MTAFDKPTDPLAFNLWHDPWIRVIDPEGRTKQLGIADCLAQALQLSALSDPSPVVVGGTQRLLIAILQAIYQPDSLQAIGAVLQAGHFDAERIAQFGEQYAERFALFHPTHPFLQTGDIPVDGWNVDKKARTWAEAKAVSPLFDEVPGTTYRAFYRHITDEQHQVCPACCARGLITIPSFASSGGAGIRPSINGVPPIYIFPTGDTLFHSLALALTIPGYQPSAAAKISDAAWQADPVIGRDQIRGEVSYEGSLTFPARRVRLYPIVQPATCSQCGQHTELYVSQMVYEMGQRRSEQAAHWQDPFVAFQARKSKASEGDENGDGARSDAFVALRPQAGKALWREYTGLLLLDRETQFRPAIVRQLSGLYDEGLIDTNQLARFRCIGIRSDGKAKNFEWFDEALDVPPRLLNDPDGIVYVEQAINRAQEIDITLTTTFNRHFRPARSKDATAKLARFHSIRNRMIENYWDRLAKPFRDFIFKLDDPFQRDSAETQWAQLLLHQAQRLFDETTEQIGDHADALRMRVQAQRDCRLKLGKKRKDWGL
jgi:CRISPR system Cascade subunit CasA